ncbi:aspartate aminotransferase family protein [Bacillus massiliglaciei]|uniref:aspartate aminotransferase family protein n=1 Tax=Bacillus massiliglaciei TaxID=1816693 RepID=UPI000AC110E0|nr:aspartate aminotransferase family protein [Bacillus massiliglaciei]
MGHSSLIKPVLDGKLPVVSHGKGIYLYDLSGKQYLDACSGAVTANIGHGVPEILQSITEQASKVSFVYRSQFTSEAAEKLAEKLSEVTGGRLCNSFFVNSGSEATETAMKIAIQHWQEKGRIQKQRIISRWMSYHGITLGALSMSGHPLRRERFSQLLEPYPVLSPPYVYRNGEKSAEDYAAEFETAVRRLGAETIAAFIAEPVIGAAGAAIVPPDGYFHRMKEVCDQYEILFIADEVMTGIGRTGTMLACEHWQAEPDIVTLGKGMSGGYTPIGAAIMTERVLEPIRNGSSAIIGGHTLSANPLSCAAALAVIEYVESHNLADNARKMGDYLMEELKRIAKASVYIGDVRGKGLLIGLELVEDKPAKKPFPSKADPVNRLIKAGMEEGIVLYPSAAGADGISGAGLIIAPPLTIAKEECDELLSRFEKALKNWQQEMLTLSDDGGEGHAEQV